MVEPRQIVPVVLCGGSGTRLWPMSRTSRPKQFLPLTGDLSLFQRALLRHVDLAHYAAPVVVTNEEYRFLVAEQAQECGVELAAILLEPVARNTAAAIAASCFFVAKQNSDQLVHVLPSDHEIGEDEAYFDALEIAAQTAVDGHFVTFGITPTEPAIGFGYIEAGKPLGGGGFKVSRFVEKPARDKAEEMLAVGNYYWNSGMFLFRANLFLDECQKLAPEVFRATKSAFEHARADLDFIRLDKEQFAAAPSISVDYAIFEKTHLAAVVPSTFAWSDLGSWNAVWKAGARDGDDNLSRGPVSLFNAAGSLVFSEGPHVAVDGLDDLVVIASEDAVYIGRLSEAQNVGLLVSQLKLAETTRSLTETHRTSYRPWGGFASILNGERFQVKKLFVKPGKRLSLQKHHHRSEHWIVVRGTAEVQVGDKVTTLRENQSIYIPQGDIHRLSNPGKILLELIEVQTGSYLGEDDIIRFEDEFGRP